MNKTMIASAMAVMMFTSAGVHADQETGKVDAGVHAAQGTGKVNFKGVIINAPCSIDPKSANQTIDFGQLSKSHLNKGGISIEKDVAIELLNCDTATLTDKAVKVSFDGQPVAKADTELATSGSAKNVAIVLNGYGKNVVWGKQTEGLKLTNGTNTLMFKAWAKKAATGEVTEGDFAATTNFTLSYN
ncbi:fimbrial protein [Providencia alcalifaciens]|uniref:fimbrial protein n=1 Tax=Providencia alcalifaciens TaxID=126385 RepID=UPI0004516377|nr:fimbrial protein [Providencia alcalifaciens]EUD08997.1 putative Pap fimbrial major pilin protein [Providencia alcalifaciens R90-1475]